MHGNNEAHVRIMSMIAVDGKTKRDNEWGLSYGVQWE